MLKILGCVDDMQNGAAELQRSVFLVNDVTKLREVDVAVLDIIVGKVNNLLLHRVQSKHFHGIHKVLSRV